MATTDDIERLRERSIINLDDAAALDHIANLIDSSADMAYPRGADRALHLLETFEQRKLRDEHAATAEYFRANAWAVKEDAAGDRGSWTWEHLEREQQILALSRAAVHPGFVGLSPIRRCQILTNRANQLDTMGRFVDALEGWDRAIRIMPRFAMAQANRAYGLRHYAGLFEKDIERAIILLHARAGFLDASSPGAVFDSHYPDEMSERFANEAALCGDMIQVEQVRVLETEDLPSLGRSKAERFYRQWCLERRLFLNPLNDLGSHPLATQDDLVLPSLREGLNDRPGDYSAPPVIGFFNQLKQEYVSARFMLFEGVRDTRVHFSDRGVRLFDTLDYPLHSLAMERVRTAYRIAYSLLDKVAFAIDHYWQLGKNPERISFKSVWMVEGKARLLDRFNEYPNWPLRGLYWLSKELFDERLKQATSPDARQLHDIRNALEHKFLPVHEGWAAPFRNETNLSASNSSVSSDLLEAKAERVLKIARSALIHLVTAIGVEERKRTTDKPDAIVASMSLFDLDDRRKRRDPM